jgi:hypothetical protein
MLDEAWKFYTNGMFVIYFVIYYVWTIFSTHYLRIFMAYPLINLDAPSLSVLLIISINKRYIYIFF